MAGDRLRRPDPAGALLGRRWLDDRPAPAPGVARDRRSALSQPRGIDGGSLPGAAAAAQWALSPRRRRALLLGPGQWLGRRGPCRALVRVAGETRGAVVTEPNCMPSCPALSVDPGMGGMMRASLLALAGTLALAACSGGADIKAAQAAVE